MPAPRISTRRFVIELVIGSAMVLSSATLTVLGIATWALTFLQAAYPCGETYQVHPSCRLADPEAVAHGYQLMIAVPALCTLVGVLLGVGTFVRWRVAILPTALAFVVSLAAFLTGQTMLASALEDVVPW